MKKLLFAALIATVAVGGAFSSANAVILYAQGQSNPVDCITGADVTCAEQLGVDETTQVYLNPANEGPQGPSQGFAGDYTYNP